MTPLRLTGWELSDDGKTVVAAFVEDPPPGTPDPASYEPASVYRVTLRFDKVERADRPRPLSKPA